MFRDLDFRANEKGISALVNCAGRINNLGNPIVATNWPAANKAYYVRINIYKPIVIVSLWWENGTAASGNVDTGIYDGRTLAKIVSTGSTARSGTNSFQKVTLTNPVLLKQGEYLLGHASDTSTNSRTGFMNAGNAATCDLSVAYEQATAFALPATAVPVQQTTGFIIPIIGGFSDKYGG
jgi:hypothetical protein